MRDSAEPHPSGSTPPRQVEDAARGQRPPNAASEDWETVLESPLPPATPGEQAVAEAADHDGHRNGGRPSRDEEQPVVGEVNSADAAGSPAMEWCAIVYTRQRRQAEFQVVVIEKDGARRHVASSPTFRPPMFGAVRRHGKAQAAHDILVSRLTASGWRPVDAGGAWHELGFIRSSAEEGSTARSLVTTVREAGSARFVAEEFDSYGNPRRLARSALFPAPPRRPVPRTEEAEAAHEELLQRLESEGWNTVGSAGPDWFSIALERPIEEGDRSSRAEDDAPAASSGRSIPEEPRGRPHREVQPDVGALLETRDVEGLVRAAGFQNGQSAAGDTADESYRTRERAIVALGELGPDVGNDAVTAALQDSSDDVRSAAVRVLESRGEIGPLATALGSARPPSGRSRELACHAILEDRSSPVARAATRALLGAPGDAPLSDPDVAFLHSLAHGEETGDTSKVIIRELLKALSEDRSEIAERAEEMLVVLAPISTPSLIAELGKDRSPERAATALGRIGDSSAVQPLVNALEHHHHESVRVQAAAALGVLRDPAAVEPLLQATRDPDFDVRAEASHALDHLGAAGVIFGMSALLRSMVMEAVDSVVELPPPDRARRPVRQISPPAESWKFR
jgi:HEAT repeat protein